MRLYSIPEEVLIVHRLPQVYEKTTETLNPFSKWLVEMKYIQQSLLEPQQTGPKEFFLAE